MRYHMTDDGDTVSRLIGQCRRNKAEAQRMFETLIRQNRRSVELFTGTVDLSPAEHDEFVARFSAEVEPTLWESSFRKH